MVKREGKNSLEGKMIWQNQSKGKRQGKTSLGGKKRRQSWFRPNKEKVKTDQTEK